MNITELVNGLSSIAGIFFFFAIGGVISDYILPCIKPLERYLRTLPNWVDDTEDDAPEDILPRTESPREVYY